VIDSTAMGAHLRRLVVVVAVAMAACSAPPKPTVAPPAALKEAESKQPAPATRRYLGPCKSAYNRDGGKKLEHETTFTYGFDEQGMLIARSERHEDGKVTSSGLLVFDAQGRIVKTESYEDGEKIGWSYTTYDEDGRIVEEGSHDLEDGSEHSWIRRMEYDDLGRLTMVEGDSGADGVIDSRHEWVFVGQSKDGPGPPVDVDEMLTYKMGDFTRVTHHYDADGRLIKVIRDEPLDDKDIVEEVIVITYPGNGRASLSERTATWEDGSVYVWKSRTTWSEDGLLQRVESLDDETGEPRSAYEYHRDAEGRLLRIRNDLNLDGEYDQLVECDYNDDGQMTRFFGKRLPTAGAEQETTGTYEYDDQGRRVRLVLDNDNDGEPEEIFIREFDAAGNLIRMISEQHGRRWRREHDYSCWPELLEQDPRLGEVPVPAYEQKKLECEMSCDLDAPFG